MLAIRGPKMRLDLSSELTQYRSFSFSGNNLDDYKYPEMCDSFHVKDLLGFMILTRMSMSTFSYGSSLSSRSREV